MFQVWAVAGTNAVKGVEWDLGLPSANLTEQNYSEPGRGTLESKGTPEHGAGVGAEAEFFPLVEKP